MFDEKKYATDWRNKNKDKIKGYAKKYTKKNRAEINAKNLKYYYKWKHEQPWLFTLSQIRVRCNNPDESYYKRGIRNFLTKEDIKSLWFRDKAYLQDRPSIDRIDTEGNYTLENCRFIELSENIKRPKAVTSRNKFITINGITKALITWTREYNIKYATVFNRLEYGWTPIDALTKEIDVSQCRNPKGRLPIRRKL